MAARPGDDEPIGDDEADRLLAPLEAYRGLVLAVSGGPDSTALMHLAAGWSRRLDGERSLTAVTVDHGLRPESAAEAIAVAEQAAALAISHRTVRWTGPAPVSGLQAEARAARYRVLGDAARQLTIAIAGPVAIVTAHTADDQAETLVMRLARGSGVDGLAAMPAEGDLPITESVCGDRPCRLLRPLLTVPRARLLATLAARSIAYADDPSNRDTRYERVRVREALAVLAGLGVPREALARTADRMRAAKQALDFAVDVLEARAVTCRVGVVHEIERRALAEAPPEIAVRLLKRVLGRAGGEARPADLASIEDAVARLTESDPSPAHFTLGGCIVDAAARTASAGPFVRIYREPDRGNGIASLCLTSGERALWDGRFWVEVAADYPLQVNVEPLGDRWPTLRADCPELARLELPAAAARGIPIFRAADGQIAVPLLVAALIERGHVAAADVLAGSREGPMGVRGASPFHCSPAWQSKNIASKASK